MEGNSIKIFLTEMDMMKDNIISAMAVNLSPEAITAQAEMQGKNDREYLTHRIKTLLEVKGKHPDMSVADLDILAGVQACGQGCCCCCGTCCNLPNFDVSERLINPITK